MTKAVHMNTVIRKWGNSPALRPPTTVLKEAGYQLEQKVELIVSKGRIIIQPSRKIEYDLDSLAQGINPNNSHSEAAFGPPVGKELLLWRHLMCEMLAMWFGWNLILRLDMNNLVPGLRLS